MLRSIILVLTAALAIALITRGNVLIGGLLAAIVVARAVLFVSMRRRRRELRGRLRDRIEARRAMGR